MKENVQIMEAMERLNTAISSLGNSRVCVLIGYIDSEGDAHTLKNNSSNDYDLAYHLRIADHMMITNLIQEND